LSPIRNTIRKDDKRPSRRRKKKHKKIDLFGKSKRRYHGSLWGGGGEKIGTGLRPIELEGVTISMAEKKHGDRGGSKLRDS